MKIITQEDIEHLKWIHNRLSEKRGESCDFDYMLKFKSIVQTLESNLSAEKLLVEEWKQHSNYLMFKTLPDFDDSSRLSKIEEKINMIEECLKRKS